MARSRSGQGRNRYSVISDGLPSQIPDVDPQETQEWLESLDAVIDTAGARRARFLMLKLLERAREKQVGVPALRSTDYVNTIAAEAEPWFPGDEFVERRIRAYIRWNAADHGQPCQHPDQRRRSHRHLRLECEPLRGRLQPLLPRQGRRRVRRPGLHPGPRLARHLRPRRSSKAGSTRPISTASARRSPRAPTGCRRTRIRGSCRTSGSSPPCRWGSSPLQAIYQARFNRYLHDRQIKDTSRSHVWAFLGDGEMDEPESLGALGVAAREELDNLTFIVNCNLQRLDGPVRGNGKIIQELESYFRGAGWHVIKVIWGREWDELLAMDTDGVLVNTMNTTPDGQFQKYSVSDGAFIRDDFFGRDPRLRKMAEHLSDDQLTRLSRGGHDYRKVYAAFKAAREHVGQPTVILAQTIKGWTLGKDFEARNATHQMKKLTKAELKAFRDRLYLEIPDKDLEGDLPPYYHPGKDSDEIQYMLERRRALGGYLPCRVDRSKPLQLPSHKPYDALKKGSGKQEVATTMAFVRLLKDLMKDKHIGPRFVPIVPDEARTFGMDAMFPTAKIYSPHGQRYDPVDAEHAAVLQGGHARPDPARRHHRGRIHGIGDRRRDVVRHARRADDPRLRLLLDVRVPAHRRPHVGGGRPADAWLPARRHRGPDHAERRRPAARGRPLAAARGDEPRVRLLRPRVRLRDLRHRRARAEAHVRRGGGGRGPRRLLLPDRLQRAEAPTADAGEPRTSRRRSCAASTGSPPHPTWPATATRRVPRSSRAAPPSTGHWRRSGSSPRTGASRPTCGARRRGQSYGAMRWPATGTTSSTTPPARPRRERRS